MQIIYKQKNSLIPFLLLCCLSYSLGSCINDYEAKDIEEIRDILVVDGSISSGQSIFTLSHSVGLTDFFDGTEYINNAKIWIEDSNGNTTIGTLEDNGKYIVDNGPLDANTEYRLRISLNGEEYESGFSKPLFTPEIDSLFYINYKEGAPVYICVSTHDPQDQSPYYRWSYEEIWEVKAEYFANAKWGFNREHVILLDRNTYNNTYYCWGYDNSKEILVDSSEKIKENIIYQKRLVEIPASDDRLSMLYYIKVKQTMLRKEAYDYFSNLQKNIESSGSIFSPIPSEMHGNIRCTTNPDISVIGYIDVATITQKDIYMPLTAYYEPIQTDCSQYINNMDHQNKGLEILVYVADNAFGLIGSSSYFAPRYCVDCQTRRNATKNKPENWPTPNL